MNNNKQVFNSKIPGAIPNKYLKAPDPAFSTKQDTILYNGKLFSGFVYALFADGDTAFVSGYLKGLKEGIIRKWYPNKKLQEERLYVKGRKEGMHKGWWQNGKQKFMFEVSNDEYTGVFREWYSDGQIGKFFHYKNGQEQGSEKVWWPDGTIRANYVIVDGQKFGLFGQKLCVNSIAKP